MIHKEDMTKQEGLYVRDGGGLFRVLGYCESPSLTMVDVATGERVNFGIHGLINHEFQRVVGLKYDHSTGRVTGHNTRHKPTREAGSA